MGLMRNKNLEMEYLSALEDLGLEIDLDTDSEEEEKNNEREDN